MRGGIPTTDGGTWSRYRADSAETSTVSTRVTASAMPSRQKHSTRVSLCSRAIVIALNGCTGALLQPAAGIGADTTSYAISDSVVFATSSANTTESDIAYD